MSGKQQDIMPEQCAWVHHVTTGHKAGGSNGYADCECGKEWHWPITEEQRTEYYGELVTALFITAEPVEE
jgi:hypothetical protein